MTMVKICGIRRPEDAAYINEVRPDLAGFILAEGFRRTVTLDQAAALRAAMDPEVTTVGVFVNQDKAFVLEAVRRGIISVIQLHGKEDEDYIAALRESCEAPIIKVFAIREASDLEAAVAGSADHILLDNKVPGSGETFDWSVLAGVTRPYFLAGGLSCDNVEEALLLKPYGVDVSSGVETDGVKDLEKMKRFLELVRHTERV